MPPRARPRALLIHHSHVSSAGHVAERLALRGWELDEMTVVPPHRYETPDVDPDFPAVTDAAYDLVVPLGAPWSVDRINTWIPAELDLLREAHTGGVPVLGICFGGQALATALGGSVERAPRFELGWSELDTSAAELVGRGPWFQFHGDRWKLPDGARELARNDVASQAFVCGRSMGVQFHPELTADTLQGWLDNGGLAIAEEVGVDAARLVREVRADEEGGRARAFALVDAFLDHVAHA
ncbi:type 1 glutamine amidotransferase [Streptomyces sp. NPDC048441]|uniref:type 1 glutamine amidotransferase n=1 Tax=Streptomyces sp. NPDC048441 TaxID=3365552 RepID=UPI0037195B14